MPRPNVILLTIECWRSDYFGATTPQLARLAGESTVFSSAHAAGGWTLPSMTALMSSVYASMFGGPATALGTPERQVLAERFLGSGYWTAGFSANSICGSMSGFHRGFGTFRDMSRELTPEQQQLITEKRNWREMVERGVSPRSLDRLCDANQLTNAGMEWLDHLKAGQSYFLWLHYMEPHWPCLTPDTPPGKDQLFDAWNDRHLFRTEVIPRRGQHDPGEEVRLRWIARYEQALLSADREIGRLIEALRARNDWDQTIVAVMGDHGEEFYEHGTWHHSWNKLYREGVQVPLIIRVPGEAPATAAASVSNVDIAPTLLDYAGIPQQPNVKPMMGRSLRPLIEGKAFAPEPIYSEMLSHPNSLAYSLAITEGDWKYIYDLENPGNSKLFHLTTDPREQHNRRDEHPGVFRRFETMRFAHVSRGLVQIMKRHQTSGPKFELDPMVREQMIALGYMAD